MRIIKLELYKAIKNKVFMACVVIMTVIAIYSAVNCIMLYEDIMLQTQLEIEQLDIDMNDDKEIKTLYNSWIGVEWNTLGASLFFLLLPIAATLPNGISCYLDRKNGYRNQLCIRMREAQYFNAKFIGTFFSGFFVIFIPMMINVLIVSCFIPAIKPDIYYDVYYNQSAVQMGSEIFYTHPLIYVILRCFISAVFGGAMAILSGILGTILNNKFAIWMIPFLSCLFVDYVASAVNSKFELSPTQFLYGGCLKITNAGIICGELFAIVIFVVIICRIQEKRNDIV